MAKAKISSAGFTRGTMQFLAELGANNDKAWFDENKPRYEALVREPALDFIRAMGPRLAKITKNYVADDRKVGGSLMRVHRDVRFSKDKTPYKTNIGIQFRHAAGKDVHAPGFYLHVDPEGCFVGCGTWHPEKDALAAIRAAIDENARAWKRVRDDKKFRAHFDLGGESLKKPPRGYDAEHPLVEDLKRKDHIAVAKLKGKDVLGPKAVDFVAGYFAASKPYVKFLTEACGLPF